MKTLGTLLRTTAGAAILSLAACGTETERLPEPAAAPAYEQTSPGPAQPGIMQPSHPELDRRDADSLPALPPGHPPLERDPPEGSPQLDGRHPEMEADIRPRYRRALIWVA